jgi:hypothetical protein
MPPVNFRNGGILLYFVEMLIDNFEKLSEHDKAFMDLICGNADRKGGRARDLYQHTFRAP